MSAILGCARRAASRLKPGRALPAAVMIAVSASGCAVAPEEPRHTSSSQSAEEEREWAQQLHSRAREGANAVLARVNSCVRTKVIAAEAPAYPEEFRERNIGGLVRVMYTVSEQGMVLDPEVIGSADPALAGAVLLAVMKWRFEPPTCDGAPIRFTAKQEFEFKPVD